MTRKELLKLVRKVRILIMRKGLNLEQALIRVTKECNKSVTVEEEIELLRICKKRGL